MKVSIAAGLAACLLLLAGCGDSSSPESTQAGAADTIGIASGAEALGPVLEGSYRFVQVNGQAPPLEWPAGSGAMLESGALEIDSVGRFAMQFIVGRGELGSEPTGQEGTYRVSADTIYFMPDEPGGSPVIFQFELEQGGGLRMRDEQQNVWTYTRRQTVG